MQLQKMTSQRGEGGGDKSSNVYISEDTVLTLEQPEFQHY